MFLFACLLARFASLWRLQLCVCRMQHTSFQSRCLVPPPLPLLSSLDQAAASLSQLCRTRVRSVRSVRRRQLIGVDTVKNQDEREGGWGGNQLREALDERRRKDSNARPLMCWSGGAWDWEEAVPRSCRQAQKVSSLFFFLPW